MTTSQAPAACGTIPPTARQREVLAAIVRHQAANGGQVPAIRELCDALGIKSPQGIACHLVALEKKGAITMPFRKRKKKDKVTARGVRVVGLADALGDAVRAWAKANGVEL